MLVSGGLRSAPAQAAPGDAGWDYVSKKVPFRDSRWQFEETMNDLGEDGWLVFQVMVMPSSEYDHGCYVFARRRVAPDGQSLTIQRGVRRP